MRFAVVNTIYKAALQNPNIIFMTGDLSHANENEFRTNLPNQYINVGIAEQNMIGIAAGLALSGKKVFAYSIVPFVTMRCFEQVKSDLCYQNLDVTLIGVGGGFIYGQYGNTHCSIEDIAVMRVLPNMKIVCPANPLECEILTKQIISLNGPTYIRIGRGKESMPSNKYNVNFGKGYYVYKTGKIALFSYGTILSEAEKVVAALKLKSIDAQLINMHTIKPIDIDVIMNTLNSCDAIFTIEEHNIIGGLGSAIAEIISEVKQKPLLFKRFGVHDTYLKEIGTQDYLRDKHGISAEKITEGILSLLTKKLTYE